MKKFVKHFSIIFLTCLIILGGFLAFDEFFKPVKSAATDNVSGWAWSSTIGWISFNCTNQAGSCTNSPYGVNIDEGTGNFSGYAWSSNIGWIDFAPSGPYPIAPNYSARYDSGTDEVNGWARADVCRTDPVGCDGWDGWILLGDEANSWSSQVSYDSGTGALSGWAWGGGDTNGDAGVIGWLDFNASVAGPVNNPPTATNLNRTNPDWCASPPAYFFSWTYSDPDNDTESRFDFQVDTDPNFNDPVYPVDRSYTNLSYPSPTRNTQSVLVAVSQLPDYLTYNTTYYWRARVWDSQGNNSGWVSGGSFTTEPHHYPDCDFTWSPQSPNAEEEVQFSDQSTCYDDNPNGSSCNPNDSWSWTFQDAEPDDSDEQNPITTFQTTGSKQVSLTITDSDGYTCSVTKTVQVSFSLPKWKEIRPW